VKLANVAGGQKVLNVIADACTFRDFPANHDIDLIDEIQLLFESNRYTVLWRYSRRTALVVVAHFVNAASRSGFTVTDRRQAIAVAGRE
jgi:hypothetical protein